MSWRRPRRSSPRTPGTRVRVGDEYTVKIFAVSRRGDGMAKIGGTTIFVPGTSTGDVVRIRIVKTWSRFAVGEVLEKLS